MSQQVTVLSGQTASPAFTLEKPERELVIFVPSLSAGSTVGVQFSATSGSSFRQLMRPDGSGLPFSVYSGAGPGMGTVRPPTPFGRITVAAQSEATEFTLVPIRP